METGFKRIKVVACREGESWPSQADLFRSAFCLSDGLPKELLNEAFPLANHVFIVNPYMEEVELLQLLDAHVDINPVIEELELFTQAQGDETGRFYRQWPEDAQNETIQLAMPYAYRFSYPYTPEEPKPTRRYWFIGGWPAMLYFHLYGSTGSFPLYLYAYAHRKSIREEYLKLFAHSGRGVQKAYKTIESHEREK